MKKIFMAILFCYASNSLFAEETTITTVTTVKTDGKETTSSSQKTDAPAVEEKNKSTDSDPFRSQLSITRMLSQNEGLEKNSARIEDRSHDLNIEQKYLLLNQYKKDGGVPFVLNMILGLGIGSFVQGDTKGGFTGLLGELGSMGLIVAGELTMYSYYSNYSPISYILLIGGFAAYTGFRIYELVRPWNYAKGYNEKLEQSLRISVVVRPYINLAQSLGPSYGAAFTATF